MGMDLDGFYADPIAGFALGLRAEVVWQNTNPRICFVFRYNLVHALLRDDRLSSDRSEFFVESGLPDEIGEEGLDALLSGWRGSLWNLDGERHRLARAAVNPIFCPENVDRFRGLIRDVAARLLRGRKGGVLELVSEYCMPLALEVLMRVFGIPREDWPHLHRLLTRTLDLGGASFGSGGGEAMIELIVYLRSFLQGATLPSHGVLADLASSMNRLGEDLVAMCFNIVGAGLHTTVNQVSNGVHCLLENPSQLQLLRTRPSLFSRAVEEILRFRPAGLATNRIAAEALRIGSVTVDRGSVVYLVLAAANRDLTVFNHANNFVVSRTPNAHLTFGMGQHHCLGAALARIILEVGLSELLRFESWEFGKGGSKPRCAHLQDWGMDYLHVCLK